MSDIRAYAWEDLVGITPSDVVVYAKPYAGLWVNVGGTVQFQTALGRTASVTVISGSILPFACKQVFATGTTATGIFGLVAAPYLGAGA